MTDMHKTTSRLYGYIAICFSAFLLLSLAAATTGESTLVVLREVLLGGWGSPNSAIESLLKSIPLALCAIAAALPARLGLVNLGGEGQLAFGAIAATGVVLFMPNAGTLSLIPLMMLVSMLAGLLWGVIPGVLRVSTGASEIVISLLMNYVAVLFLLFLIHGPWKDPTAFGWAQSVSFPEVARLQGILGTRLHMLGLWVVVLCVLFAIFAYASVWGMSSKIAHHSMRTASYLGVNVSLYTIVLFSLGGALAGLAGMGEVSAIHGRLREGITTQGYGYVGFLIAWLCRGNFEWIIPLAVVFGGLMAGADSLQVVLGLPASTMYVIFGGLLLAMVVTDGLRQRLKS